MVLSGTEAVAEAPPDSLDTDLIQEAAAVCNVGFGGEFAFTEEVAAFASFATDFSSSVADSDENILFSNWDIYHVAGGADFPVGPSSFTVGAVAAWGSAPGEGLDLTGDAETDRELGLPEEIDVSFFRLTFILGFTIVFE